MRVFFNTLPYYAYYMAAHGRKAFIYAKVGIMRLRACPVITMTIIMHVY